MANPYRTPATVETPKPKLSFWCRIGWHRWEVIGAGISILSGCQRSGCSATQVTVLS